MDSTLTTIAPALEFPAYSPALAHTRNVRGDLGLFVNPYDCSCTTCLNVVEEEPARRPQSTGTLEASDSEDLLPPAPPLVRVSAFADALGRLPYNPLAQPGSSEADIMSQLSTLRLRLKAEQDAVEDEDFRSHDEMAAADAQWDELDAKISAIEDVLTAFGIAFEE